MAKPRWHILREAQGLTLARRLPVRFDISVQIPLPKAHKLYLAQQIRQDLWRRLQKLRGFTPVVQVIDYDHGLLVRAGGQVQGAVPKQHVEDEIRALLTNSSHQSRWLTQTRLRLQSNNCPNEG